MTYMKPDGTRFVLASHTPVEWADVMAERLRALGCSEKYIEHVAAGYRGAAAA